ncbi:MAG: DinB family protein [Dehalococcoidia bacterium]
MAVPRAQETIDKAAEERARFADWVRSVPDEQWSRTSPEGIWQARDYVAHLASIDPLLTGWFRSVQDPAQKHSFTRGFSIDEWNEERILARRNNSIDDVLAELESNRAELNAALADFTDEQLDSTIHFGGDAKRAPRDIPLHLYLRGWVYHDRWHMEDARRAIAGEAEQPFGDEAFARAAREQRRDA